VDAGCLWGSLLPVLCMWSACSQPREQLARGLSVSSPHHCASPMMLNLLSYLSTIICSAETNI
jgi:hypothetical protein